MDAKEARGKALRILADAEQRRSEELEREAAPHIAEQKAALKQALTYIAAGAGLHHFAFRGGSIVFPIHGGAVSDFMVAIQRSFNAEFRVGELFGVSRAQSRDLDELTDKLWEMGVRA